MKYKAYIYDSHSRDLLATKTFNNYEEALELQQDFSLNIKIRRIYETQQKA